MSRRPIGYYVHHQGAGHWQRACAVAAALDRPTTLIGTFAEVDTAGAPAALLDLPDDRIAGGFDGLDGEADRPRALHYAPLGVPGLRARMGRIAAWCAAADPIVVIVDVSVEVALLARLMSVPTLVVRLGGLRTDTPHLEAFRAAERVLAFLPPALDPAGTPDWVRAKTFHAGFLAAPVSCAAAGPEDGSILVVYGRGGAGGDGPALAAAARAVPERAWHVLGPVRDGRAAFPPNLRCHGWVPDTGPWLDRAALVVGAGGEGVVSAVAARGKRFVCIPEARPFDEQAANAAALHALGAAVHCPGWPPAAAWPEIVRAGLALDPAVIAGLARPGALARTADLIESIAGRLDARRRR